MKRLPAICESRGEATFGTRCTRKMIPLPINWWPPRNWRAQTTCPRPSDFAASQTDGGTSHVVWKDVQIAADKLMIFPDPTASPSPGLFVMNVDGSDLRQTAAEGLGDHEPRFSRLEPRRKADCVRSVFNLFHLCRRRRRHGLKRIGSGVMPTYFLTASGWHSP